VIDTDLGHRLDRLLVSTASRQRLYDRQPWRRRRHVDPLLDFSAQLTPADFRHHGAEHETGTVSQVDRFTDAKPADIRRMSTLVAGQPDLLADLSRLDCVGVREEDRCGHDRAGVIT
jgi:hypothetical protein